MTSVICPGCLNNKIPIKYEEFIREAGTTYLRQLVVTGSRSIDDYVFVSRCLWDAFKILDFRSQMDIIFIGDAKGVDHLIYRYCLVHRERYRVFPAYWGMYGRKAGVKRNSEMVKLCTQGIAIWDGKSKGTLDCINKLRSSGKLMKVYLYTKNG